MSTIKHAAIMMKTGIWLTTSKKQKKEALRYVADGVDKTYAIITNQGQRDTLDFDADDSSISYDVADIVYSAIKRNGRIIESFTETSNN